MIHFGRSVDFGKLLVASFAQQHGTSVIKALKKSMVCENKTHCFFCAVLAVFPQNKTLHIFRDKIDTLTKILTKILMVFFHIFKFQMSRSSCTASLGSANRDRHGRQLRTNFRWATVEAASINLKDALFPAITALVGVIECLNSRDDCIMCCIHVVSRLNRCTNGIQQWLPQKPQGNSERHCVGCGVAVLEPSSFATFKIIAPPFATNQKHDNKLLPQLSPRILNMALLRYQKPKAPIRQNDACLQPAAQTLLSFKLWLDGCWVSLELGVG